MTFGSRLSLDSLASVLGLSWREGRDSRIARQDQEALDRAQADGFVVRRSLDHNAHIAHAERCRRLGLPCVCVHLKARRADVTLDMPAGSSGWALGEPARLAATRLIRQVPRAAYGVGPCRIAVMGVPAGRAPSLARRLYALAIGSWPLVGGDLTP